MGIGPLIACLFLSFAAALCINYFIPFAPQAPRAQAAAREGQLRPARRSVLPSPDNQSSSESDIKKAA
jgi:hypothetical protein